MNPAGRQVGRRGVQAGGFGDGAALEDVGGELVGALFEFVRYLIKSNQFVNENCILGKASYILFVLR